MPCPARRWHRSRSTTRSTSRRTCTRRRRRTRSRRPASRSCWPHWRCATPCPSAVADLDPLDSRQCSAQRCSSHSIQQRQRSWRLGCPVPVDEYHYALIFKNATQIAGLAGAQRAVAVATAPTSLVQRFDACLCLSRARQCSPAHTWGTGGVAALLMSRMCSDSRSGRSQLWSNAAL
jgi:hypothetical protein